MEKLGLILLTVAAGMCNGFQAPVNAALGRYVGIIGGLACLTIGVKLLTK